MNKFVIVDRNIIDALFCVWFVSVSLAGLTTLLNPLFSWVFTIFLVVSLVFFLQKEEEKYNIMTERNLLHFSLGIVSIFFVCQIVLVGFFHHQYGKALVYGVKFLFIILLLVLLVLYSLSEKIILQAVKISLFINVSIVSIALFFGLKAGLMIAGDGRIGTIFNEPGTLWKIGFYSSLCFAVLYNDNNKKNNLLYFILSVFLMALDGSRTSQILILFMLIFLIFINFEKEVFFKKILNVFVVFVLLIMSIFLTELVRKAVIFHISGNQDQIEKPLALWRLLEATAATPATENDLTRSQMILYAIKQIHKAPLEWGKGIEFAKVPTSAGEIVVHMTYFQLWIDYGILACFTYLLIFILITVIIWKKIFKEKYIDNWVVVSSAYIFFSYAFMSLLHPLSNEITYWAVFIVFLSYVLSQKYHRPVA